MQVTPLHRALSRNFGFDEFRAGQHEVISAVLQGRDAAVYWPTGCGKSVCYQLPPLIDAEEGAHDGAHGGVRNGIVVVVSPLISLITDQVNKLNNSVGRGERRIAAALGGAAFHDGEVESAIWRGEIPLIYVTPEKLLMGSTLSRLAQLHGRMTKLMMLAVDEAHCVSEWGHDFRPEYRKLIAFREMLPDVPILALTATAVPNVRDEIERMLGLRSPLVSLHTALRSNLKLKCKRKLGGGMKADLRYVITQLKNSTSSDSTLIYAPTKNLVEEVYQLLLHEGVACDFYHAGRSPAEREQVHMSFLSGEIPTIVATIAFGMGIDKPDIRRVVHYGAPKTIEEYYQQIGRAGRDGGYAECLMITNDRDFTLYSSDFYVENLSPQVREATLASTDKLRKFASETVTCRWRLLLDHFGERNAAADCGVCDTCVGRREHAGDTTRDFGAEANLLMLAIRRQRRSAAWSHIKNTLESPEFAPMRAAMQPQRKIDCLREFLPMLCQERLVLREAFKGEYSTYDVYSLTREGVNKLADLARSPRPPLMLPVPESIRALDQKDKDEAEAKRSAVEAMMAKLAHAGISLSAIPHEELQPGATCTPVCNAFLMFDAALTRWRNAGRESYAIAHETLLQSLMQWRKHEAARLRMAQTSVFADHIATKIAYVKPASEDALLELGARLTASGVQQLLDLVKKWKDQWETSVSSSPDGASNPANPNSGTRERMVLPDYFQPARPFEVAKISKKPPMWQISHQKFESGDSLDKIAISQENGKPILPSTVLGHVLKALTHGCGVSLARLAAQSAPPDRAQWEQLDHACAAAQCDVLADSFERKAIVSAIVPEAALPFNERSEQANEASKLWYRMLDWYVTLHRAGISQPQFVAEQEAKRPRI